MPRKRTKADVAAGKLISAVQTVYSQYAGTDEGYIADAVMNRAHELHQAISAGRLSEVLGRRTIRQFLDEDWITFYPDVEAAVRALEFEI